MCPCGSRLEWEGFSIIPPLNVLSKGKHVCSKICICMVPHLSWDREVPSFEQPGDLRRTAGWSRGLGVKRLGFIPSPATYLLCDLGSIT